MTRPVRIAALLAPLALGACVVPPPTGPSVMALPKQGEDFSRFQAQDANCRNYASAQIGNGSPAEAATQSAVGSAVLGTAVGAAAGAALGSLGGAVGAGAAVGAAGGLLVGSAAGASNAQAAAGGLQQGYDTAYTQCMYANGYTVQQPSYYAGPAYPPVAYAAPAYGYYPGPYPYYPYYGPSVAIGVGGWGGGWGHRGYGYRW
jgi:hypothetical protein